MAKRSYIQIFLIFFFSLIFKNENNASSKKTLVQSNKKMNELKIIFLLVLLESEKKLKINSKC